MSTCWIIHDVSWGYLLHPEYPTEWSTDRGQAHRFRHKRDALRVVAQFAPKTRERLLVEPLLLKEKEGVLFD
jgi:hypothetical protein